jgi:hypothetical protein
VQVADALIALALLEDAHAELARAVPHACEEEFPLEDVSHYLDHALEPLRSHVNEVAALPHERFVRRLVEFYDYLALGRTDDAQARAHVDAAARRIRQAVDQLATAVEPADGRTA